MVFRFLRWPGGMGAYSLYVSLGVRRAVSSHGRFDSPNALASGARVIPVGGWLDSHCGV